MGIKDTLRNMGDAVRPPKEETLSLIVAKVREATGPITYPEELKTGNHVDPKTGHKVYMLNESSYVHLRVTNPETNALRTTFVYPDRKNRNNSFEVHHAVNGKKKRFTQKVAKKIGAQIPWDLQK